jgi:hypothetical protein
MSYYELLLIGGLTPSRFLRNFKTKPNGNACKPVEVFQEEYKEKGNQEIVAPYSCRQLYII